MDLLVNAACSISTVWIKTAFLTPDWNQCQRLWTCIVWWVIPHLFAAGIWFYLVYTDLFFRQDCRFDQVWLVIKYPYVSIHIHKYPYISININEYLWISMNMRNIHKYPPSLLSSKNLPRPPVQVAAPPFGRANLSCLPGCPGCTPFRIVDLQRAVTTFEFRYESHDGAMWAMVNTHG